MVSNEYRILLEAYTQASNDGDTDAAEALLKELDGFAILAQHDRIKAEKAKGWRVGGVPVKILHPSLSTTRR